MRVVVIDADSGLVRGEIPNTPGVHGVALAPDLGRGATSNGRDQSVTIFNLRSLETLGHVRTTGGNPDAIVYEPATHRVFTFNGAGQNATAIDLMAGAVTGTVALGGKPEFAVAPGDGRIYVNIENTAELVVLDARSSRRCRSAAAWTARRSTRGPDWRSARTARARSRWSGR